MFSDQFLPVGHVVPTFFEKHSLANNTNQRGNTTAFPVILTRLTRLFWLVTLFEYEIFAVESWS